MKDGLLLYHKISNTQKLCLVLFAIRNLFNRKKWHANKRVPHFPHFHKFCETQKNPDIRYLFDLFDLSVTVTLITAVTLLLTSSRNWAVTETGSTVKGCFLSRTPLTRSHPYFLVEFIKKGQSRGLGQGVRWGCCLWFIKKGQSRSFVGVGGGWLHVFCDAGKRGSEYIWGNFSIMYSEYNNLISVCRQFWVIRFSSEKSVQMT